MKISSIHASEEHSQHIGRVYQEYYARLRHYFLMQLGDAPVAERCVQETIRRFFFFMEDRCWEEDAEYISVYLMRIAGFLCSRRLAEKNARRSNDPVGSLSTRPSKKMKDGVVGVLKKFRWLFPGPEGSVVGEGF